MNIVIRSSETKKTLKFNQQRKMKTYIEKDFSLPYLRNNNTNSFNSTLGIDTQNFGVYGLELLKTLNFSLNPV